MIDLELADGVAQVALLLAALAFANGFHNAAAVAVAVVVVALAMLPRRKPTPTATPLPAQLRIAFVHPDLGIGGAERLIVDAAVGLQKRGHGVVLYTAHHDAGHCFEETRDGTLAVVCVGDWLPKRVLGRCYAACAYLRMCYAALYIAATRRRAYDVIIVDQVSICLPLLRLAAPKGTLFYCHYPDKLLCASRESRLKRLYRLPLDWAEETTTGCADAVVVNSKFTAATFRAAFSRLAKRGVEPAVLYPALNLEDQDAAAAAAPPWTAPAGGRRARSAVAKLPEPVRRRVLLVVAGGYDADLPENVEHAAELEALAKRLGIADRVLQKRSVPAAEKAALLRRADVLLYTPDKEHFGIVPLEAMYAGTPVLAVDSGGPLESVVSGETGFLRPQDPQAWADAIEALLSDDDRRKAMGARGRKRVQEKFALEAFAANLDAICRDLAKG
ncbi:sucrose synthase [Aureococcus anophagefferens]|nr:sucrose synthase [Aureococcus anophagefferens]